MILTGTVSVKLKNGRIINGFYTKDCRDVVVRCYDSDFFGETQPIDTTNFSVKIDARWALENYIREKGGEIDE